MLARLTWSEMDKELIDNLLVNDCTNAKHVCLLHHRKALCVIKTTVRNIFTNVSKFFTKMCAFTPGQVGLHLILLGMGGKDNLSLRRLAYRQKHYDSIVLWTQNGICRDNTSPLH